jgi:hypothetical protein
MGRIKITKLYAEDPEALKPVQDTIDTNSKLITEIVDDIVKKCSTELDDYMDYVRDVLHDENHSVTNTILEDITMSLPIILYNVNDQAENLSIQEDMAKAHKTEVYNNIYNNLSNGTIADKTAIAELESQAESMMQLVYQHAHKKLRAKNELGLELLQSVKKVLTKRITELEISINAKL